MACDGRFFPRDPGTELDQLGDLTVEDPAWKRVFVPSNEVVSEKPRNPTHPIHISLKNMPEEDHSQLFPATLTILDN